MYKTRWGVKTVAYSGPFVYIGGDLLQDSGNPNSQSSAALGKIPLDSNFLQPEWLKRIDQNVNSAVTFF